MEPKNGNKKAGGISRLRFYSFNSDYFLLWVMLA
jgi:hypothetical protein